MIQIENVSKVYSGKVKAVDALSLTIEDGEIIGFIGPNGAGKTTTIKMMTGILSPDTGRVLLNGIDIVEKPIEAKRQFGLVTDNPDIFLRLKGIEYLNFMADIYDVSQNDRRQRIQKLAETFEMSSALNDKILSYSHGMRQKIVVMGLGFWDGRRSWCRHYHRLWWRWRILRRRWWRCGLQLWCRRWRVKLCGSRGVVLF